MVWGSGILDNAVALNFIEGIIRHASEQAEQAEELFVLYELDKNLGFLRKDILKLIKEEAEAEAISLMGYKNIEKRIEILNEIISYTSKKIRELDELGL